jgi:hypothetical protein
VVERSGEVVREVADAAAGEQALRDARADRAVVGDLGSVVGGLAELGPGEGGFGGRGEAVELVAARPDRDGEAPRVNLGCRSW